jgi:hypothetical protein
MSDEFVLHLLLWNSSDEFHLLYEFCRTKSPTISHLTNIFCMGFHTVTSFLRNHRTNRPVNFDTGFLGVSY